ncbi:metallophosphoesterase [Chitinophaga oryzae]|uniref:Metallophosphoesterase n=1 Tax=Chitinophaga oryzae TaxID=2725414 RepID=A0AAE6ZIJ7_9BACT|nr:metallophosphoesterase [Chitinophaga oryzae]QJB33834.1 metallophosphoesterase [Chitinophaga oryzae]QJB40360.1 metallophosphoesterase [Chitinophaga oryzae]
MIIIGDLHGGYPELLSRIKKFKLEKTTFIQVGDWGLGFQPVSHDLKALSQIDSFMRSSGNQLLIIRGNHDNKWFWDQGHTFGLQHIQLVKDYTVMEIAQQRVLFVGGGISIDRLNRTAGKTYWPDEELVYDEALLHASCQAGVDIVISHIAPREIWPYTYNEVVQHFIAKELSNGHDLAADLENERQLMSRIYHKAAAAGCHSWYYGHYHESHTEEKNGIAFRCVSVMELYDAIHTP